MSGSAKVVYGEVQLVRALPVNIKDNDKPYYSRSSAGVSRAVKIMHYHNVTVNNEVFMKLGPRIRIEPNSFGDDWQDKVYNKPLYQLKSFVKDRLRTKVRFDTVLWCWDLFSTGGYFHWLTEICPRVWIAQQEVDPQIPLLIPEYFLTKWKFGRDLLAVFNREIITFKESELPTIAHLIFIERPGGPFNYQPVPIKNSTLQIQKRYYDQKYPNQDVQKIYISRRKAGKRMILNEDHFMKLISEYGYTTFVLEDLSIYDQVNLFSRATSVLSIHGAGLTNMVYMSSGGSVIEIRHQEDNNMLNCFYTLAHTFGHRYYYSFGHNKGDSLPTERRPEDKSIHADLMMLAETLSEAHSTGRHKEIRLSFPG